MSARPLISAEVGSGTSHVNIHGETGLVVPPGNPRALRAAMDSLQQEPERARLMGQRARQRYEQLFTGRRMGERYADAYRRILALRPVAASA
jgi:rhamnosyl/mannosyltransferase